MEVCRLDIDLSKVPLKDFQLISRKPKVYRVVVEMSMSLAGDKLSASVSWRENELAKASDIPY